MPAPSTITAAVERQLIAALAQNNGNISAAARIAGVSKSAAQRWAAQRKAQGQAIAHGPTIDEELADIIQEYEALHRRLKRVIARKREGLT